jgi:hypothetical protein
MSQLRVPAIQSALGLTHSFIGVAIAQNVVIHRQTGRWDRA